MLKTKINFLLLIALIAVFVTQQYITFLKYEDKFVSPVAYTKQTFKTDFISQYENRTVGVSQFLTTQSHLGYCSEPNQDMPNYYLHYVLSQYYLTPHLISKSTNSDTILYNLPNSQQLNSSTNVHLNSGWHIIKNFNNGYILIAK